MVPYFGLVVCLVVVVGSVYTYTYIYIYIYVCVCVCVLMWHKVIFELSLTSLKSEFSFSRNGCHTNVKELSLPYYLHISGGRRIRFISFQTMWELCEMQYCPRFELRSLCPSPIMVTIIPWMPPIYIYIYTYKNT